MRTPITRLRLAAALALGGCYATSPPPRYAQPPAPPPAYQEPYRAPAQVYVPVEAGTTIDIGEYPPDEGAPDVEVFYDALAPYGRWEDHPRWGRVWIPSEPGYRPYERGHWQLTDYGFTWIPEEPFGWAVTHYGRWA